MLSSSSEEVVDSDASEDGQQLGRDIPQHVLDSLQGLDREGRRRVLRAYRKDVFQLKDIAMRHGAEKRAIALAWNCKALRQQDLLQTGRKKRRQSQLDSGRMLVDCIRTRWQHYWQAATEDA
jgi:hypothetical protein